MRNQLSVVFIAICVTTIFSCKKSDDKDTTPAAKTTATLPVGYFYTLVVNAQLILEDSLGNSDTLINYDNGGELGVALYSAPPTPTSLSLDADSITLNDIPLEKGWNEDDTNMYSDAILRYVVQDYKVLNGTNWKVKGKGSVPPMVYNDTRKHPDYTGPMPKVCDRSKGFSMTFDASNVSNADSVTVGFGSDTTQQYFVSKTYAANAGTITISPSDLSKLNPDIYGLDIVAFTRTIQYFGGNPYEFVREKRVVRYITVK
jgi:hypothetical protein